MSEFLNYLNSPHLVANFQKVFGVESRFDSNNDLLGSTNTLSSTSATSSIVGLNSTTSKTTSNRLNANGNDLNGKLKKSSTKSTTPNGKLSNSDLKLVNSNGISNKSNDTIPKTNDSTNSKLGNGKISNENSNQLSQNLNLLNENKTKIETIGPNSLEQTVNSTSSSSSTKSSLRHRRQSSNVKTLVNVTDHVNIVANTTIHSRFWYYLFRLGAAMGNEVFYCLFFPFWFWNVDGAIARKVGFLWGIFMYLGQATKDLVCMPRPASPPVVKLEHRYIAEYGFPSTHAMVSAGLPISVVFLSYSRYNIDLPISIAIASLFCFWVCCSRLYLGMHSLLDVIAGVLYSILVLMLVFPILELIDTFMLENEYSPFIALTVGYAMLAFYPSLKQWSTARGDTAIIIGTVVGFSVGAYFNNLFGWLNKPDEPPLYDIRFPNAIGYLFGIVRTIIGLAMLLATRQLFKFSLLRFLCYLNNMNPNDPVAKQTKKIELPYYYISYFAIGVNIAFTSPMVFRLLRIERDYSYTEL